MNTTNIPVQELYELFKVTPILDDDGEWIDNDWASKGIFTLEQIKSVLDRIGNLLMHVYKVVPGEYVDGEFETDNSLCLSGDEFYFDNFTQTW